MVNKLQTMKDRVVKVEIAPKAERVVTGKGGLVLAQAAARKLRLYSQAQKILPRRLFDLSACVASMRARRSRICWMRATGQGILDPPDVKA